MSGSNRTDNRPRVVIIGAGFGGLSATRALGRGRWRVTLLDRNNYHLFQPLLYQVVGAPLDKTGRALVAEDLSVPAHPEVFVIGDLAAFVHQTGQALPGLAPVAIQQGRRRRRFWKVKTVRFPCLERLGAGAYPATDRLPTPRGRLHRMVLGLPDAPALIAPDQPSRAW